MNYNFLKEDIKETISSYAGTIEQLENFITFAENNFILKHNIDVFYKLLKFLDSPDNIFILNGFTGSGKTYTADAILNFVSDKVLIFRNSYQEAINLDDVLLSLFKEFYNYHNEKKVILPKIETNVFSDKINAYLKYCNVPMLFIFDSFEINMRSKDTQKDILDFINYLSHFEKIKVIICSRTFKKDNLISQDSVTESALKALTKEEADEYLGLNKISGSKYETEEFYKITRGHYFLIELSVLIINLLNIKLDIFLSEYKKSAKNIQDFVIEKILSVSSDKFIKLLILLATLRHGVPRKFLTETKIADEDDLIFLMQKHVISEKFGMYYLKDYMKNEIRKKINIETKINIHKFLINLYEDELPLKPFERELFLSRQTMRQEIAYHTKKISNINEEINKGSKNKISETQDFNYISYSRTSGYDKPKGNRKIADKRYIDKISHKAVNKIELSEKDSKLLYSSNSQDNLSKQMYSISNDRPQDNLLSDNTVFDMVPECLDDYIKIAENYEIAYNYSSAILYYKKALTYTSDENFKKKEPGIYSKMAICYKKIQETDEAVRLFEKAYDLYRVNSDERANDILFNIAKLYSEVYKFEKAKEVYKRILYSPEYKSPKTVIRVYLDLAELEDNNGLDTKEAVKYAQMAIKQAEKLADVPLLAECYFKYAILFDDGTNTDMALKYYLRCTQVSDNPKENGFLASSYTNLAELSKDNKNTNSAKMYYELAIEADKKLNNYEGLYFSFFKLAGLYKNDSYEKAYDLLNKALSCAKKLDDISYTVNAYIEIGDLLLNVPDLKKSLKSYILAKNLAPVNSSDDFITKINKKINYVKYIAGDEKFNLLLSEIKKKR